MSISLYLPPMKHDALFFDISVFLFFGSTTNDKSKPTIKYSLLQNPSCRCTTFASVLVYRPVWPTRVVAG